MHSVRPLALISPAALMVLLIAALPGAASAAAYQSATPAAATAACWDWGCDGKSPVTTGCYKDAVNITAQVWRNRHDTGIRSSTPQPIYSQPGFGDPAVLGRVKAQYSPSCGAQWTVIESTITNCSGDPCQNDPRVERPAQPGYPHVLYGPPAGIAGAPHQWSRMVGAVNAKAWSGGTLDTGVYTVDSGRQPQLFPSLYG